MLVAGIARVATHDSTGVPATPTATAPALLPPSSSTTTSTTAAPGSIQAFVPEAERFVELHRGLTFKRPVTVTVLDDAAFRQRIASDQQPDKTATAKTQTVLRALGLIPPELDLGQAQ